MHKGYKMTHRDFGAQVKKLRKLKGIKKDDIAKKVGLSYEEYTNVERGRKFVDDELIAKLEDVLDTKFGVEPLHTVAA